MYFLQFMAFNLSTVWSIFSRPLALEMRLSLTLNRASLFRSLAFWAFSACSIAFSTLLSYLAAAADSFFLTFVTRLSVTFLAALDTRSLVSVSPPPGSLILVKGRFLKWCHPKRASARLFSPWSYLLKHSGFRGCLLLCRRKVYTRFIWASLLEYPDLRTTKHTKIVFRNDFVVVGLLS